MSSTGQWGDPLAGRFTLPLTPEIANTGMTPTLDTQCKPSPGALPGDPGSVREPMDSTYTVETARSLADLLHLREAWQEMSRDANGDLDFFLTVNRSQSEVQRPHVISVKQGGAVKAILVARIDKRPLDVAVGYKKLSSPPVRFLSVVYGGVLGDVSEEIAALLVESVQEALRSREADVALFHALDDDSALHRILKKAGNLLTRDYCPAILRRWATRLPGSYEEFLKARSSNTRHNAKRYSKKFQTAFEGQSEIRIYCDPADIETMLSHTEMVASKTYHRGLGVGFVNNELMRNISTLAAAKGWLRAYVLYVRGEPAAFWNGWLYRRTFFAWTTGYLPELHDYRAGTFLLQKMFADLCAGKMADEVNFGFGDAQYKRDWSDHDQSQVSVLLFAPTVKGVSLNLVRTPLVAASSMAHSILARTDLLQKIKKAWRNRAAKVAAPISS